MYTTMQCCTHTLPGGSHWPVAYASVMLPPSRHSRPQHSTCQHQRICINRQPVLPVYSKLATLQTFRASARAAGLDDVSKTAGAEDIELQEPDAEEPSFSSAVVRIKVVKDLPRFDMPLLLGSVLTLTRTAVAVQYQGQQFLLTTATSVVYSNDIKVYVPGQDTPFKAQVAHLAMEADLAVLRIVSSAPQSEPQSQAPTSRRRLRGSNVGSTAAAAAFWQAVAPLGLGNLPSLGALVQVLAAPAGEDTAGRAMSARVACVEVMAYPLASYRLLGLRLSGAASKARMGSPVVDVQGRCVGLVFQTAKQTRKVTGQRGRRQTHSEELLNVVPAPIIKQVLDGVIQHGRYIGFSQLGIRYKHLDSPALRGYLGMQQDQQGVLVLEVNPTSAAASQLRVGDVIMALQGQPVGNDGSMAFEHGGRLAITHKVTQFPVGSVASLTVLRQGKLTELSITLSMPHRLLPTHLGGVPPSFLLVGGLVLTTLSVPYLEQSFGPQGRWMRTAPPRLLAQANTQPQDSTQQVVVVAHCSDAQGLIGYKPELIEHQQVVGFRMGKQPISHMGDTARSSGSQQSGSLPEARQDDAHSHASSGQQPSLPAGMQRVHDLRQLAAAVLACRDGEVWLALGDGSVVVQGAAQAAADARALIAEYEVPAPVSADLLDLLPSRKGPAGQTRRSLAVAGRR